MEVLAILGFRHIIGTEAPPPPPINVHDSTANTIHSTSMTIAFIAIGENVPNTKERHIPLPGLIVTLLIVMTALLLHM